MNTIESKDFPLYNTEKYYKLKKRTTLYPYIQGHCPICGSAQYHVQEYYGEFGIEEKHNECPQCGYREEMCYSDTLTFFHDTKRGHLCMNIIYKIIPGKGLCHKLMLKYEIPNRRKHKRIRRNLRRKSPNVLSGIDVNPIHSEAI